MIGPIQSLQSEVLAAFLPLAAASRDALETGRWPSSWSGSGLRFSRPFVMLADLEPAGPQMRALAPICERGWEEERSTCFGCGPLALVGSWSRHEKEKPEWIPGRWRCGEVPVEL